jgi:thiol-disulfide isomerase/thioredoxin
MITELTADPKTALKIVAAGVVVFYASWCGDSQASEEYEKAMAEEFDGKVAFFRLDAVELEKIADIYEVERYPTYIFFRKGKAVRGNLIEPCDKGEVRNWIEMKLGRSR